MNEQAIALNFSKAAQRLSLALDAWKNYLTIREGDVKIATTPKTRVFGLDKMNLYRYEPLVPAKTSMPLFLVYGLIGRQTMLDLQEDRSIVRNLLAAGIPVYVVDWGQPGKADRFLRFDDYVEEYVARCVEEILVAEGTDQLAMLGVCEGGVFAACYAALHPDKVARLATAVTPFDFHADQEEDVLENGFLNRWARNVDAETSEALIDSFGYLPGQMTGLIFQEMTPGNSATKYNWELPGSLSGPPEKVLNFLRMEKWLRDRPHHPGAAAKQWINELYRENRLAKGEFYLDGQRVDLANLTMPVLNIFATRDHIVPKPTSRALGRLVGSDDYRELELPVGHIGTFVSRRANTLFSDTLAAWLLEAQLQTQVQTQVETNQDKPSEAAA